MVVVVVVVCDGTTRDKTTGNDGKFEIVTDRGNNNSNDNNNTHERKGRVVLIAGIRVMVRCRKELTVR